MLKLINISKERVFMKFWQYTREMIFHQKVIIEMSDSDDTIVGDLEDLGPSSTISTPNKYFIKKNVFKFRRPFKMFLAGA